MVRRTRLLGLSCLVLLVGGVAGWWVYYSSRPEYRLRHGQAAIRAGDHETGERMAAALEGSGFKDQALLLRGESLFLRGEASGRKADVVAAVQMLYQVGAEGDFRLEAACVIGRCLLHLGNPVEAEKTFSFVLSRSPDYVDAHRGLMAVCYDLGALTEATFHAEKWAELAPRDGRPHRFLGLVNKDMGQWQAAVARYRAALERELKGPVREEVRIELAECLIRLGDCAGALTVLELSRPPAEQFARVLTSQGECHRVLGDTRKAAELAEQALDAGPSYTSALRLRAQLALDADDAAEAVGDLERAAALAPNEFDTQHLLGRAYAQLGQPQKAQAAQQRVKEIQALLVDLHQLTHEAMERPKDAALHNKMADLLTQLGKPQVAALHRRVAASLSPAPGAVPASPP